MAVHTHDTVSAMHFFNQKLKSATALTVPLMVFAGTMFVSQAHALDPNALPQNGVVAGGDITIGTPVANHLTIGQTSNRGLIKWDSFNIGTGAGVQFNNGSGITVNQVTGNNADPSRILGKLGATGKVMILDRNGVFFGQNAQIDVGGIVASTGMLADEAAFLDGTDGGKIALTGFGDGKIENEANFTTTGVVGFIANEIVNTGDINASNISFAAGNVNATIDFEGDGLVEFALDAQTADTLINNTGDLTATGGRVALTAAAKDNVVNSIINMDGIVKAKTVTVDGGKITLGGNVSATEMAFDADTITQSTGGRILVKELSGTAQKNVTLAGAQNKIDKITDIATGLDAAHAGGVDITNNSKMIVSGAVTTDGGDIRILNKGGDLHQNATSAFDSNGGDIELSATLTRDVYILGDVDAGAGDVTINSSRKIELRDSSAVKGQDVALKANTFIQQSAGGAITGNALSVDAGGDVNLTGNNDIKTLQASSAGGDFAIHDVNGFSVKGDLASDGDINITTNSNAQAQAVAVDAGVQITTQGGDFNVDTRGGTGGGFTLGNGAGIDTTGVGGKGDVNITSRHVNLAANSAVIAGDVYTNNRLLTQHASSRIVADSLSGKSLQTVSFMGADNQIDAIGDFQVGLHGTTIGSFNLVNAKGLDITGSIISDGGNIDILAEGGELNINSGSAIRSNGGNISLTAKAGSSAIQRMRVNGTIDASGVSTTGDVALKSAWTMDLRAGHNIVANNLDLQTNAQGVTQTGAGKIKAQKLTGATHKAITLTNADNEIAEIGDVTTGTGGQAGGFTLNEKDDVTVSGAISTNGGDIALDVGGNVNVKGSLNAHGGDVAVAQTGTFTGAAGSVQTSGTGTVELQQNAGGSINNAVNAIANTGTGQNTVTVGDGVYAENTHIKQSNLDLVSRNGASHTRLEGVTGSGVANIGTIVLNDGVENVRIGDAGHGFTIVGRNTTGETAGIYLRGTHKDITIQGNEVVANGDLGIVSRTNQVNENLTITGNIFSGKTYEDASRDTNSVWLVYINPGAKNLTFTDNVITGDSGYNGGVGIDSDGAVISGNVFASQTTGRTVPAQWGRHLLSIAGNDVQVFDNTFVEAGLGADAGYILAMEGSLANADGLEGILNTNTFNGKTVWADAYTSNRGFITNKIQPVIDAAALNAIVTASGDVFEENVTINKSLTLQGTDNGASRTVLQGNGSGSGVVVSADDVTLRTLDTTGHTYGISIGADIADLAIDDVRAHNNTSAGLKVGSQRSVQGLSITDSAFDNNAFGYYDDQTTGANAAAKVTDVHISNSSFSNNTNKGFYSEKLDNATLENVTFAGNAGYAADINLKRGDYENIVLDGVTSDGTIAIKVRNDSGYGPTTLDGLTVKDTAIITGAANTALMLGGNMSNAEVSGNTFIGGKGITAYENLTGDLAIVDNLITSISTTDGYGVGLAGMNGARIADNTIIAAVTGVGVSQSLNTVVENNDIVAADVGVGVDNAVGTIIRDNSINGVRVGVGAIGGTGLDVEGNTINGLTAVELQSTVNASVVRNTLNGVTGVKIGGSDSVMIGENSITGIQVGIAANGATNLSIDANTINGVTAIDLQNVTDADVVENVVRGATGVKVGGASTGVRVFNNNLANAGASFFGFPVSYAIDNGASAIVDARGNWFGSASEGSVANKNRGNVDYSVYLAEGTDSAADAGFQGDFSHLFVTARGGSVEGKRIQSAVDLLADGARVGGDRIIDVLGGVYNETNTALNKSVTLRGVSGASIVQGADAGYGLHITADDVSVTGMTLRDFAYSMLLYGADNFVIRNNDIAGARFGIYAYGPTGSATSGLIENNRISDIVGGHAIHTRGGQYANILGNTIRDADVGITVEEFAVLRPDGQVTLVDGNDIEARHIGIRTNLSSYSSKDQSGFVVSNNAIRAIDDTQTRRWTGIDVLAENAGVATTFLNNTIDGSALSNRQSAGYEVSLVKNANRPVIDGGSVSHVGAGVWVTDGSVFSNATTNGFVNDVLVTNVAFDNISEAAIYVEDTVDHAGSAKVTIGTGNVFGPNVAYDLALAGYGAQVALDGGFAGVSKTLVKAAGLGRFGDNGYVTDSASIQTGVDATRAGGDVDVEAGTFQGNVTIDKALNVRGAGSASTLVQGTGTGSGFTLAGSDIVLDGMEVAGFANGLFVNSLINALSLDDVSASGNRFAGLYVNKDGSIDGLNVTDSHFDNNAGNAADIEAAGFGWFFEKDGTAGALDNVTNVRVSDTTFSGNLRKGLYAEKLSDAEFNGITVENTGINANYYYPNAGIELNLKNGHYADISFDNVAIRNTALDSAFNGVVRPASALSVKARNDGSYAANPASLTNVTLNNVSIDAVGNTALAIGNNVQDVKATDVTINNATQGVVVYGGARNVEINNATIASSNAGIVADNVDGLKLHNNTVNSGLNGVGVYVKDSRNVVIGHTGGANTINGGLHGVYGDNVDDAMISRNVVTSGAESAITVANSDRVSVIDNNFADTDNVDDLTDAGIVLLNNNDSIVMGNVVSGRGVGIEVNGGAGNQVSYNSDVTGNDVAIRVVDAADTNVGNNVVSGNGVGVEVAGTASGTVVQNNTISGSGIGVLTTGGDVDTLALHANTLNDNATGMRLESGLIDLGVKGQENRINRGSVGMQLAPVGLAGSLKLQGDTLGFTRFAGQSDYYVRLENGAYFVGGVPYQIDAVDVTFDGINAGLSPFGRGILTLAQLQAIEGMLWDLDDETGRGQIFAGYVPGIDQNDLFPNGLGVFGMPGAGFSVTITGLPTVPGMQSLASALNSLTPFAGGDAATLAGLEPAAGDASELNAIAPAAGETTDCWSEFANNAGISSISYSVGGTMADTMNAEAGCSI